jgi:peroxiredoxin
MELNTTLAQIKNAMAEQLPTEVLDAFGGSLMELINANIANNALKLGDTAPDFTLKSSDGEDVTLYELLQKKSVILSFFRGSWCPFCVAELEYYQQYLSDFENEQAAFIAISPQTVSQNRQLKSDKSLNLKLLSDANNQVARQFGLVFSLQDNIRSLYKEIGADLAKFNGDDSFELPIPATYVIGKDRNIAYAFVDENYMERAEPAEVKKVLHTA